MVVMKMIDHNHRHHHHRVGSSSVRISDFLVSLSPSPDSPRKISAITCCLGLWLFFVWLFPIQVWSLDYCLVLDLSSVQWIPDVSRMSNAGYWSSNWLISLPTFMPWSSPASPNSCHFCLISSFDMCLWCQMSFFRELSVVWPESVNLFFGDKKNWLQIRQIHNVYCKNFLNLREVTKARDWNINSLFPSSLSQLARLGPNPDGLIHAAIHKLSNVSNRGKSSKICQNQPFIRCQG